MSSESSDDMPSGVCSQDSNANVAPSCSENTPLLQLASLCLIDSKSSPRRRPQGDSDYDSGCDASNGKRKQRSQEPEPDVQKKKLKKDETMECAGEDSQCQSQSEKSDAYEYCEADNEEEDELERVEESSEKCDGACGQEPEFLRMDDEPLPELPLIANIIQSSTSGLKRKNIDKLESPTVPKVKRSYSNLEDIN